MEYNNLAIIGLTFSFTVFILTKFFSLKEVKEKKKGMMFNWVHEKLTGDIYTPLSTWAMNLSEVLRWKNSSNLYRETVFLYNLSKFLKFLYMNRKVVGDDIYFTRSYSSNYYLKILSELIVLEVNHIFDVLDTNKACKRLISIEFLSILGYSENYTEFMSLLHGRNISNDNLSTKVKTLRDNMFEEGIFLTLNNQIKYYINSTEHIFNNKINFEWGRVKLYSYCCLFYHIISFELSEIYSSWYKEEREKFNRNDVQKYIKKIIGFIEETEIYYMEYLKFYDDVIYSNTNVCFFMNVNTLNKLLKKINLNIKKSKDLRKEELKTEKKLIMLQIYEKTLEDKIKFLYTNVKCDFYKK